jgi:polysaccharide biosynthesis protein PslH
VDACGVDSQVMAQAEPALSEGAASRCLWIARYIPYPLDEGAKVYSANLAQALAHSGVLVRFMGLGELGAVPAAASDVEWLAVPGGKRSKALAAFSAWPIAAAVDATKAYRLLLEEQLREPWDVVVLDGYGAGWALDRCLAYRAARDQRPVLVHVSHNHEENLWRTMAEEGRASTLKRLALRSNANKVSTLERRIVRNVDLLTAITDEDRLSLGAGQGHSRSLSLTPGYSGPIEAERRISASTPRRVIIVGSFHWVVKQENLARFIEIADPIFREHGIELDIVGEVPPTLLATLKARCRATSFHGFVSDVAPFLARARIAIVPESIGGGFKLKFLDYIFGRVPIATLSQAAAGLSEELRRTMLSSVSLAALVGEIVSHIDKIDELNQLQERAFALGKAQFNWNVRGEQFRRAIDDARSMPAEMPVSRNLRPRAPGSDLAAT